MGIFGSLGGGFSGCFFSFLFRYGCVWVAVSSPPSHKSLEHQFLFLLVFFIIPSSHHPQITISIYFSIFPIVKFHFIHEHYLPPTHPSIVHPTILPIR